MRYGNYFTDPITGRDHILSYVELGSRVVDGIRNENCKRSMGLGKGAGGYPKSKKSAIIYRAHAARARAWKKRDTERKTA